MILITTGTRRTHKIQMEIPRKGYEFRRTIIPRLELSSLFAHGNIFWADDATLIPLENNMDTT